MFLAVDLAATCPGDHAERFRQHRRCDGDLDKRVRSAGGVRLLLLLRESRAVHGRPWPGREFLFSVDSARLALP